jgi:hypothetical protein
MNTTESIFNPDLTYEPVFKDGNQYRLGSYSRSGASGTLSGLVYDAGEQTLWSKGGGRYDVEITRYEDCPYPMPPSVQVVNERGETAEWPLQGDGAEGDGAGGGQMSAVIQKLRAKALVRHAIS